MASTYPDGPYFNSGDRDSAWFMIYDRSGSDRLVLTTGREAALRAQRALKRWLETNNPDAAAVFQLDGAVGPHTLDALYDWLEANGRHDLAVAIAPVLIRTPSLLPPEILTWLLAIGWGVPLDRIGLTVSSGDSLPYNRRAPSPRGPGANIAAIEAFMASGGNTGDFVIVREGQIAQRSTVPIAASGQAAVTTHDVERYVDPLAPVLPNDGGPTITPLAIVGFAVAIGVLGAGVWWLAK